MHAAAEILNPLPVRALLRSRWHIVRNVAGQIRSYLWLHVIAGIVTFAVVTLGGTLFFRWLFRFLLMQEPFGPPLMERLMAIVLLAFFSMLVFSNLIVTLTTTYISKESEFLFGLPFRATTIFSVKLTESVIFSSWAFAVLSLPLFMAYGLAKGAPAGFYGAAALLGIPFLTIPACAGAVVTMIVSAWLPARRARYYALGLLLASLGLAAVMVRLMGLRSMLLTSNLDDFTQIMALLNAGSVPLLPNYWLARGLQAASEGQWRECGYWFLVLTSTAAMAVQVCLWLVPALFYRGWVLAREGSGRDAGAGGRALFSAFDRIFGIFGSRARALCGKDMRAFWRDPAQWSQLVILFGILVLYIANIRGLKEETRGLDSFIRYWPLVLSFFNLGAVCFVLSILTTRFVFPLLSLEGKQYWVVGLAPFPKSHLVYQKYSVCAGGCVLLAAGLTGFSNHMLDLAAPMRWLNLVTVLLLGFGLTSLAVGLSALFPNFREDNPARIANGLGGTLNIAGSLAYIIVVIALEIPIALATMGQMEALGGEFSWRPWLGTVWPFFAALGLVHATVIVLPMRLGLRHWERLEFHF